MRNRFYLLVTLILSCLCSYNLDAKSAVKKITYFGHEYKGEVVDNAPKGHGTMVFNGFTIEGIFSGNEVTDAHITVGDFEVGYEGTLTYNESQKVILKAGGTLTTDVYEYDNSRSYGGQYGVVTGYPLRKETKPIEKIINDKLVGVDYFNVKEFKWYLPIDLSQYSFIPKELDAPVVMKPIKVEKKIRVKYAEEKLQSDGTITEWKPWDGDDKEIYCTLPEGTKKYNFFKETYTTWKKCRNPKTKTIFVYDSRCTEGSKEHDIVNKMGSAFGDKDEQGRIWYCDENRYHVTYPNGDFCSGNESSFEECRVTHPNNVVIETDIVGYYGVEPNYAVSYTIYDNDKKLVAKVNPNKVYKGDGSGLSKLLFSALESKCDVLPRLDLSECKVCFVNGTSLSLEQICNLLKNEVLPRFDIVKDENGEYKCKMVKNSYQFPKSMQDYGRIIEVYLTDGYYPDGVYFVDKDQYYSYKEIYNLKSAEEEAERARAKAEKEAYIASRVAPLKKAFGVNPFDYYLGKVLKVGASFKDLQKYFELSVEAYKEAWGITDRYYYFSLYQDHGSSKCYDFGYGKWLSSENELGHIWVTNGKVSSVTWY